MACYVTCFGRTLCHTTVMSTSRLLMDQAFLHNQTRGCSFFFTSASSFSGQCLPAQLNSQQL